MQFYIFIIWVIHHLTEGHTILLWPCCIRYALLIIDKFPVEFFFWLSFFLHSSSDTNEKFIYSRFFFFILIVLLFTLCWYLDHTGAFSFNLSITVSYEYLVVYMLLAFFYFQVLPKIVVKIVWKFPEKRISFPFHFTSFNALSCHII